MDSEPNKASEVMGLEINLEKTILLSKNLDALIQIDNEKIKTVKVYKYLS